ncbi:peptidoglycan DD-metalloendopeptidase family protein [Candidatus Uhrbacteria bacterium]|nr:peptidoglycan DD-metalloendopeptidase family protein [Candidatus Uhrbacteria bacterium]
MNDGFNNYYYEDPQLGVEIPGLEFSGAYQDDDTFVSNYLGEYVAAVYAWLIPTASLLVVLVIMVGGLQWMLARGDSGRIGKAKERIKNAVTGLILLMGAYTFTYIVDPSLSSFDPFTTNLVAQKLEEDTSGAGEGISGGAIAADCEEAVTNALGSGACTMSESLGSPTGDVVSCNYHFVDKSYNWANINSLDYVGQWDSSVYAPFTGTVTHFFDSAGNACGNGIKLSGSGGAVYLCHLKDWGGTTSGQSVSKGDVIGHVGGRCCAGENPPSDWSAASYCTYTGTECSTGNSQESCDCQAWEQSGNTTGGHVHLTYISGGNMIACFDESNY